LTDILIDPDRGDAVVAEELGSKGRVEVEELRVNRVLEFVLASEPDERYSDQ
jgi:phosphoribosylformylglycinamidine (FGAM) synthase PurS component